MHALRWEVSRQVTHRGEQKAARTRLDTRVCTLSLRGNRTAEDLVRTVLHEAVHLAYMITADQERVAQRLEALAYRDPSLRHEAAMVSLGVLLEVLRRAL